MNPGVHEECEKNICAFVLLFMFASYSRSILCLQVCVTVILWPKVIAEIYDMNWSSLFDLTGNWSIALEINWVIFPYQRCQTVWQQPACIWRRETSDTEYLETTSLSWSQMWNWTLSLSEHRDQDWAFHSARHRRAHDLLFTDHTSV